MLICNEKNIDIILVAGVFGMQSEIRPRLGSIDCLKDLMIDCYHSREG